jgi:hypothetical protein
VEEKGAAGCEHESDFVAMFDALGDRKKQDEIRGARPDGRHCELLEVSPNACLGCKHNPHEGPVAEAREILDRSRGLVSRALELADAHELRSLDVTTLHPTEYFMLELGFTYRQLWRDGGLAEMIASRLSKFFIDKGPL